MARGNQRDKAREAAAKKAGGVVSDLPCLCLATICLPRFYIAVHAHYLTMLLQKHKTTMTGSEQARNKDTVAAIMQAKQAAGKS